MEPVSSGTVGLYTLENEEGETFYVGSSLNPTGRLKDHQRTYGSTTTMTVVGWCDRRVATTSERELILDLLDQGFSLLNKELITPSISSEKSPTIRLLGDVFNGMAEEMESIRNGV